MQSLTSKIESKFKWDQTKHHMSQKKPPQDKLLGGRSLSVGFPMQRKLGS